MEEHQKSGPCLTAVLQHSVKEAVAAVEIRFEEKFKKQAKQHEKEMEKLKNESVYEYVSSFCRRWMQRKPDPLFDFVVYRDSHLDDTREENQHIMQRLLVGIPGPKRTVWEGGLYPVMMIWENGIRRPPKCKFVPGLCHINVHYSGTVYASTLQNEIGWHPEIIIEEILFDIQQLLAHPNLSSPKNAAAHYRYTENRGAKYDRLAKKCACKYQPTDFQKLAKQNFKSDCLPNVLVDSDSLPRSHHQQVTRRPVEPVVENEGPCSYFPDCRCSCCAWGSSSHWNNRREMRFFFGC